MSLETDGIPENDDELRAKLAMETARIGWDELQRFYAKGYVVGVAHDMDLVEVGVTLVRDDKPQLEQWINDGKVGDVKPEQAQHWFDTNAELWAVVVAPWVLVQDEAGQRSQ